jgi:hypothetical protein
MANLIRFAKSGHDWTENDLEAYNIQLQFEDAVTFFGDSILPLPEIDEEILTTLEADDMLYDSNAELINLLDLAMGFYEEPAVNDFTVELFKRLGYVKRNRVARTQKDISFFNSGEWMYTMADICLLDLSQDDILLVVQEDKRCLREELRDPRPQLIAKAIAAFDRNNHLQWHAQEQTVESKVCRSDIFAGVSLICFVDHAWHRPGWYYANLFQDPCHWQPRAPRALRHVPAGTYRCFHPCSKSP